MKKYLGFLIVTVLSVVISSLEMGVMPSANAVQSAATAGGEAPPDLQLLAPDVVLSGDPLDVALDIDANEARRANCLTQRDLAIAATVRAGNALGSAETATHDRVLSDKVTNQMANIRYLHLWSEYHQRRAKNAYIRCMQRANRRKLHHQQHIHSQIQASFNNISAAYTAAQTQYNLITARLGSAQTETSASALSSLHSDATAALTEISRQLDDIARSEQNLITLERAKRFSEELSKELADQVGPVMTSIEAFETNGTAHVAAIKALWDAAVAAAPAAAPTAITWGEVKDGVPELNDTRTTTLTTNTATTKAYAGNILLQAPSGVSRYAVALWLPVDMTKPWTYSGVFDRGRNYSNRWWGFTAGFTHANNTNLEGYPSGPHAVGNDGANQGFPRGDVSMVRLRGDWAQHSAYLAKNDIDAIRFPATLKSSKNIDLSIREHYFKMVWTPSSDPTKGSYTFYMNNGSSSVNPVNIGTVHDVNIQPNTQYYVGISAFVARFYSSTSDLMSVDGLTLQY